ncbi:metallophosphoesterase [bacterium]|nr:MAG: metallophosphoesterase [bacterium]
MKKFVIFFSIVLSIYSLINLYIFQAGWSAIPSQSNYRVFYVAFFFLVSTSFIVGRILGRKALSAFAETLTWIGSFWLAWMLYLFLFVVLLDVTAIVNDRVQFLPENGSLSKPGIAALVSFSTLVIVLFGHLNARTPRVKKIQLSVSKTAPGHKSMRIVVASDIHLGTIIGKSRINKIVGIINRLDPDLVLLPGDVVDEDLAPVIKENLGESLRNIKSRFGVISVTGNHEFIGGVGAASRYLQDHGITVLRDETVKIDDSFYVVGRDDRSVNRFNGHMRKTLDQLTAGLDKRLPMVLMDHQPFHLEESVKSGIDLQLSGHTHHGQLWPLNFITKKVFEVSWGYKKIDNTHIYVSSGVGTWGPPVRVGNRPEIVQIDLKFV